jgi:hypothetical protein
MTGLPPSTFFVSLSVTFIDYFPQVIVYHLVIIRVRSPLLSGSLLISFPVTIKMFQFVTFFAFRGNFSVGN